MHCIFYPSFSTNICPVLKIRYMFLNDSVLCHLITKQFNIYFHINYCCRQNRNIYKNYNYFHLYNFICKTKVNMC